MENMKKIMRNPLSLATMGTSQTEELCKEAVKRQGVALKYVNKQTLEICTIAVKNNGYALKFVNDDMMNKTLCLLAVRNAVKAWEYVPKNFKRYVRYNYKSNIDTAIEIPEIIDKESLEKDPWLLEHLVNQTDELCLIAINRDPYVMQYVKNKTENVCMCAVKLNGLTLQHIPKDMMTDDICKAAINNTGHAIKYIDNPSYELCMTAIKNNPLCAGKITIQDVRVYIEAHKLNPRIHLTKCDNMSECMKGILYWPDFLQYCSIQTHELRMAAIKQDGLTIRYSSLRFMSTVEERNIEELAAVKQNPMALQHINKHNQTISLCLEAIKRDIDAMKYSRYTLDDMIICTSDVYENHEDFFNEDFFLKYMDKITEIEISIPLVTHALYDKFFETSFIKIEI
jgi:hypothetical protein